MSPLSGSVQGSVPAVESTPATVPPRKVGDDRGIHAGMYFARMQNGKTHYAETADRLYELIAESGATVQDVLVIGDTDDVAFPSIF